MRIDRPNFIHLQLKHIAALNRLAGTHEGLGHLEEGRRWGRKAAAAREDLEALLGGADYRPIPEQAEDPCDTPQCRYYIPDEDPDPAEAVGAGGIDPGAERGQPEFNPPEGFGDTLRWGLLHGRQTNPPRGAGKGARVRVFREDRHGDEVVSEKGIVYQHDGSDDGDMPWCIVGTENSAGKHSYLESRDIKEWKVA